MADPQGCARGQGQIGEGDEKSCQVLQMSRWPCSLNAYDDIRSDKLIRAVEVQYEEAQQRWVSVDI